MATADRSVCFVDVESTGLDPDQHEIWEVALISPVAGEDTWNEQVWQLPVDLSRADPMALNIGRFHDRRLPSASLVPRAMFAHEFVRDTGGLHLVGACVSFDVDRLWRLVRAAGECPMWHYHSPDVEALAAGWLRGRMRPDWWEIALPPWKSTELSRAVGVEPDAFDRHTALGDARWAKAIYEAVMGS